MPQSKRQTIKSPELAEAQALVVLIDQRGSVRSLFTDAEDTRGLIPGHMLAECTSYRSAPLDPAPQIGQAGTRYSFVHAGASVTVQR